MSRPAGVPSFTELRPLAVAPPRLEEGAVLFSVEQGDVRVAGDARLVSHLVGLCDGRRTVAELVAALATEAEELPELLALLLEHGVLIDCTQAYRVFHWQSSTDSGYFRSLDHEQLMQLASETFRPSSLLDVSQPLDPVPTALAGLTAKRSSALPGSPGRRISFGELSAILASMYGGAGTGTARPVPSGGGLYPLAIHVVVRLPVSPLGAGLWWYDPAQETLRLVRGDHLELDELFLRESLSDRLLAAGNPVAFVSADLERPARKYANRGYRWALIETGAALQNAHLVAAELDVPVRAIGGFADGPVHAFLELDERVRPLLAVLLGR